MARRSNAGFFERLKGPSSVSYAGELRKRRHQAKLEAARLKEADREEIRREREKVREANKLKRRIMAEDRREEQKRKREEAREAPHKAIPSAAAIQRAYDRGAKTLSEAMEMARGNPAISTKDPRRMTAGEVNKELDRLDKMSSALTDEMIAAGRGYETHSETMKKEDALARRMQALSSRRAELSNQIDREYGPGAPSRFPHGWKRMKYNPRGSKGKFQRCVESVAARGTARDPKAVCGAMEKRLRHNPDQWGDIVPGDHIKASFDVKRGPDKGNSERMWVRVTKAGLWWITGKLDNVPVFDHGGLGRGDTVRVRRSNIVGHQKFNPSRKNPAEAATKAYRDFHGREPDESITISRQVHFHRHLAAAGELRRLDGETIDGAKFKLKWGRGEKPILAFNEQRNQLFIEGGKQQVDLPAFGIKSPHELETLGRVTHIDYFTRKDHLGSEGGTAIYRHKFRTVNEDGKVVTVKILKYPDLIYRVRDKHLEFSGGSYTIEPEGIDR